MLTIEHPEVVGYFRDLNYGLVPFYKPAEDRFFLVIKANKETILTARINNEFKIYFISNKANQATSHLGLVSAFFDDHDEPLVLITAFFADDAMLEDFSRLLCQREFDIYFFDELNREMMGVKAFNESFNRFRSELIGATYPRFKQSEVLTAYKRINNTFATRVKADDAKAYAIKLGERLYPDDLLIMNMSEKFYGFNEKEKAVAVTSLERSGEPGPMQERDIALMMKRVFNSDEIYLNPFRVDTERELTDILVVTEDVLLFIQAKDSPNTEDMLRRTIDRKRTVIRSHIQKASNQLKGALAYARDNRHITIKVSDKETSIPTDGKQSIGLIIVRELFDSDYFECSKPVLTLVRKMKLPAILLDYGQLHLITQNVKNPVIFINGLYSVLDAALKKDQFPKTVWTGKNPNQNK